MDGNFPFTTSITPSDIATSTVENLLQSTHLPRMMIGPPPFVSEVDRFRPLWGLSNELRGNHHTEQNMCRGVGKREDKVEESSEYKNGGKGRRRVLPRVASHTRSIDDILDDGYRWWKYGQKAVKNSAHPRSYYRCTRLTCHVKKQVQKLGSDSGIVITTHEGVHNHPCEKTMESLAPFLRQLHILTRF